MAVFKPTFTGSPLAAGAIERPEARETTPREKLATKLAKVALRKKEKKKVLLQKLHEKGGKTRKELAKAKVNRMLSLAKEGERHVALSMSACRISQKKDRSKQDVN